MAESKLKRDDRGRGRRDLPDLAELCRIHEIGLDLIGRSHDVDELLDRVLDEYESRLSELPSDALDARSGAPHPDSARQAARARDVRDAGGGPQGEGDRRRRDQAARGDARGRQRASGRRVWPRCRPAS